MATKFLRSKYHDEFNTTAPSHVPITVDAMFMYDMAKQGLATKLSIDKNAYTLRLYVETHDPVNVTSRTALHCTVRKRLCGTWRIEPHDSLDATIDSINLKPPCSYAEAPKTIEDLFPKYYSTPPEKRGYMNYIARTTLYGPYDGAYQPACIPSRTLEQRFANDMRNKGRTVYADRKGCPYVITRGNPESLELVTDVPLSWAGEKGHWEVWPTHRE